MEIVDKYGNGPALHQAGKQAGLNTFETIWAFNPLLMNTYETTWSLILF
jgi:hypothetical protein